MILPAVILLLPVACSVNQFVPAEGVLSEDNYAIIRSDTLLIIVRPQNYPGSYHEINSRFFPLYFKVKNTSSHKIHLNQSSFSILCNEKQYDSIPLDYVLADLERRILLKQFSDPFAPQVTNFGITYKEKEQEMYYELVNNAFSFGDILPGAIKEGYLFYNREIASAKRFTIDILGNTICFVK